MGLPNRRNISTSSEVLQAFIMPLAFRVSPRQIEYVSRNNRDGVYRDEWSEQTDEMFVAPTALMLKVFKGAQLVRDETYSGDGCALKLFVTLALYYANWCDYGRLTEADRYTFEAFAERNGAGQPIDTRESLSIGEEARRNLTQWCSAEITRLKSARVMISASAMTDQEKRYTSDRVRLADMIKLRVKCALSGAVFEERKFTTFGEVESNTVSTRLADGSLKFEAYHLRFGGSDFRVPLTESIDEYLREACHEPRERSRIYEMGKLMIHLERGSMVRATGGALGEYVLLTDQPNKNDDIIELVDAVGGTWGPLDPIREADLRTKNVIKAQEFKSYMKLIRLPRGWNMSTVRPYTKPVPIEAEDTSDVLTF